VAVGPPSLVVWSVAVRLGGSACSPARSGNVNRPAAYSSPPRMLDATNASASPPRDCAVQNIDSEGRRHHASSSGFAGSETSWTFTPPWYQDVYSRSPSKSKLWLVVHVPRRPASGVGGASTNDSFSGSPGSVTSQMSMPPGASWLPSSGLTSQASAPHASSDASSLTAT